MEVILRHGTHLQFRVHLFNAIHCIRDSDKGCLHDVAIDAGAKNACILIKIKLNVGSPVRI